MYSAKPFAVDDPAELFEMVDRAGFGHVVSSGPAGFVATGLPFLVDRTVGERGVLRGHFARANPHWQQLDGRDVLVLFQLTDGYVTPSWYPSKAEHGKVVPTWDYEVVQVRGSARVHDDVEWVRRLVTDLTDHHEATHPGRAPSAPWAVSDAPAGFVDGRLRAIVGVEIVIDAIDGSRKLSQNRPAEDRAGVVAGLESSDDPADLALGRAVRSANPN